MGFTIKGIEYDICDLKNARVKIGNYGVMVVGYSKNCPSLLAVCSFPLDMLPKDGHRGYQKVDESELVYISSYFRHKEYEYFVNVAEIEWVYDMQFLELAEKPKNFKTSDEYILLTNLKEIKPHITVKELESIFSILDIDNDKICKLLTIIYENKK